MKKTPLSIGITFTDTALFGLPETSQDASLNSEYEISLPEQIAVPPFKHIVVTWDPRGHIPAGVYDVPHLDIHFFMITPGERSKITARGDDIARCNKKLPARFTPSGYILPSDTEQRHIGSHWIFPLAAEFIFQSFTKTSVYGSYNGELVFLQPMAALAFLRTKPNITNKNTASFGIQRPGLLPHSIQCKIQC